MSVLKNRVLDSFCSSNYMNTPMVIRNLFPIEKKPVIVLFFNLGQEPAAQPQFRSSTIPRAAPTESARIIQEPAVPKEPPPEPEFLCDPPSISAFDL